MSTMQLLVRSLMTEAEAAPWATEQELSEAASFGSMQRRREYLTWRAVLRQQLGADLKIAYNEVGAPILPDREEYISVSHTRDRVVVMLSDKRVGVDIERLDRRFGRILSKYLTPREQALSSDNRFHAAAWCAKEAIYKWAGIEGLSFEEVEIVHYEADRLMARIRGSEAVELRIEQPDDEHILVRVES